MLGIKVRKENAEKAKRYLRQRNLLNLNYKIFGKGRFIYIPVFRLDSAAAKMLNKFAAKPVIGKFAMQKRKMGKRLKDLISTEEKEALAYDVLGNIAIINESEHAKELAKAVMKANQNIKTVVMKKGAVKGKYRKRHYAYVLGKKNYIATYKENGCTFVFDIRKAFFSSRLAYERKRITEQVKEQEHVLVMFAGVGPFAIEIAKHKRAEVAAIELNKYAYTSMLENARLNKTKITAVHGDVKKVARRFAGWADRIVMPLPKSSYDFLEQALETAKNRCIVHYYTFGKKESALEESKKAIKAFLNSHGAEPRFLFSRTVRPYSPSEVEIVVDFEVIGKRSMGAHKNGNKLKIVAT
ncbi:MAG: class I SAM-dependent methyltransferase family protein [Candidatus Micrarchaeaceae archaeon]